jgi:16S rRNA (adenine1518-N6/adenine1519-N6)-dimethyltransferase
MYDDYYEEVCPLIAYLDNSATTKPCKSARENIIKAIDEYWGNPSSLHSKGIEADMLLLESRMPFKKMTFMVQKEVADRLCATPKDSDYGAVTASVNYYGSVKKLFNVSAGNFMPAPKVDSAVIQITLYEKPPVEVADEKQFFSLIKAAFEQRRKTLVNALNGKAGISKDQISLAISNIGLDINIRGERLGIEDFAKLSDEITRLKKEV